MMRIVSWTLAVLLPSPPRAAHAQSGAESRWPERPITMIVPCPPAAAADVVARLVGRKLAERLGQPVIIENRAGASGTLGAAALAKAAPDGYTLGIATSTTHATAPILNPKLAYDPVKDFAPIAMIGVSPYVLTVHPGVPASTVAELIALAKAKPRAHQLLVGRRGEPRPSGGAAVLRHGRCRAQPRALQVLDPGRHRPRRRPHRDAVRHPHHHAPVHPRRQAARARGDDAEPRARVPGRPDPRGSRPRRATRPCCGSPQWRRPARRAAIVTRLNREISDSLGDADVTKLLAAQSHPGRAERARGRARAHPPRRGEMAEGCRNRRAHPMKDDISRRRARASTCSSTSPSSRRKGCCIASTSRSTRIPSCIRWCAASSSAASRRISGAPSCSPTWSIPPAGATPCRSWSARSPPARASIRSAWRARWRRSARPGWRPSPTRSRRCG